MRFSQLASLLVLLVAAPACSVVAGAFGGLGSFVGTNSDDSCDRRFGDSPAAFCQEISDTVAGSEFQDDCRDKHHARAGDGLCPRDRVVGGCHIDKHNDDGSQVTDWYYDVSDLVEAGVTFAPDQVRLGKAEVQAMCADPKRYEDGAHYVDP